MNLTEEDVYNWDCVDCEEQQADFIRRYVRTEEQAKWMRENDYSVIDIITGNYPSYHQQEIIRFLHIPWNRKVEEIGLRPKFFEDVLQ